MARVDPAFAKLLGRRPHELPCRPQRERLAGHPERGWASPGGGVVEVDDPVLGTLFEITSPRVRTRAPASTSRWRAGS